MCVDGPDVVMTAFEGQSDISKRSWHAERVSSRRRLYLFGVD